MNDNIVEVKNLKMYFPVTAGALIPKKVGEIRAVDDVSFFVRRGETLGLVGESGSGKTTVGMCLLQLQKPTSGEILYDGQNLLQMNPKGIRTIRRKMQAIFQDPFSSLDPRMTAADIIAEALKIHHLASGKALELRIVELMTTVGISPTLANRFPHEFSAGQRQRLGIARALAVNPEFIVCDEPVSALDVSVQAQIIHLLEELQTSLKLTYLFIAHDLGVVGYISHRVAVIYLGRLQEIGTTEKVFSHPLHPYTAAMLASVPVPDRELERNRARMAIKGDAPSAMNPPSGCHFHPRCSFATSECRENKPPMKQVEPERWVACWHHF